jgi:IS1 family transposase
MVRFIEAPRTYTANDTRHFACQQEARVTDARWRFITSASLQGWPGTFYTDQYVVYEGVIPSVQHQTISKKARKTNHIERFNNTLTSTRFPAGA